MPNRRDFFRTIAGATAGLFAAGGEVFDAEAGTLQAGSARRREVSIGGRRIKVVDVHGHFIEPSELDVIKDTNLAANISSQLNGQLVLGAGRLRALDEQGIDVQVLSHQGGWWYGADRELARRIVTVQNEKLAAWCAAHGRGSYRELSGAALPQRRDKPSVKQSEYRP